MVCFSSWQEKAIPDWESGKNNLQVNTVHCGGGTLLLCQNLLQISPETEGREVLEKHLQEGDDTISPSDSADTEVHSWIPRSWRYQPLEHKRVTSSHQLGKTVPLPSPSWRTNPIMQFVHGAKPGTFMWCPASIKGHRRRTSCLTGAAGISRSQPAGGRMFVCSRWHTGKKDGLNHLHRVTKIKLSGSQ